MKKLSFAYYFTLAAFGGTAMWCLIDFWVSKL